MLRQAPSLCFLRSAQHMLKEVMVRISIQQGLPKLREMRLILKVSWKWEALCSMSSMEMVKIRTKKPSGNLYLKTTILVASCWRNPNSKKRLLIVVVLTLVASWLRSWPNSGRNGSFKSKEITSTGTTIRNPKKAETISNSKMWPTVTNVRKDSSYLFLRAKSATVSRLKTAQSVISGLKRSRRKESSLPRMTPLIQIATRMWKYLKKWVTAPCSKIISRWRKRAKENRLNDCIVNRN